MIGTKNKQKKSGKQIVTNDTLPFDGAANLDTTAAHSSMTCVEAPTMRRAFLTDAVQNVSKYLTSAFNNRVQFFVPNKGSISHASELQTCELFFLLIPQLDPPASAHCNYK